MEVLMGKMGDRLRMEAMDHIECEMQTYRDELHNTMFQLKENDVADQIRISLDPRMRTEISGFMDDIHGIMRFITDAIYVGVTRDLEGVEP